MSSCALVFTGARSRHKADAVNVASDDRQAFIELVPAMIDRAHRCSWQPCAVQREVRERNNFVVTAVVGAHARGLRERPGEIRWQLQVVGAPAILVP